MQFFEQCPECAKVTRPPGLCAECEVLARHLGILRGGILSTAFLQDYLRKQGEAFVIAQKMVAAMGDGATAHALTAVVATLGNADRVMSGG